MSKTGKIIWKVIKKIFMVIGITLLCLLAVICGSNITIYKGHHLEDYRGSVILKEEADSVGSIPIVRYWLYTVEGNYETIHTKKDMDFYNVGDTIR